MSYTFDRIAPGSLVLVTGATGLIGSSVTTSVLDRGFRVRAATRSVKKQQPFQQYLEGKYGKDAIEFVEVTDFTDPKVWDALLEGVQGVIHLATDTSFSPRYDEVVPGIEALTETFLAAVARAPHVKSVVMTSSRIAVFNPTVGQDLDLTVNDWADYMVDLAKTVKEDDPMAPVLVYAASKPHFAFNAILPDYVAGPAANPTPGNYSTHTFLNQVFKGDANSYAVAFMKPASRFVDVRDTADIHLAALTESRLDGQRLWAAPHKFTIDDILAAWREAFPNKKILPDFKFEGQPDINIDDQQSTALLKAFKGADWYSLKDTVVDNVKSVL